MTARTELCAIGDALTTMGASARPIDFRLLGQLLKRLALVYGRIATLGTRVA